MKRTPVRKIRPTLRRGELTPMEKTALRLTVFERAQGVCELGFKGCFGLVGWDYGHLVHMRAKRRFGFLPSKDQQVVWGCANCHLIGLHNPKPCPKKGAVSGWLNGMNASTAEEP
jgi:hypothetical protein